VINPAQELRDFFTATLVSPAATESVETAEQLVQRRWVSAVTLAVGSFMMAWTIRISPGDPGLYATTLALGTTWVVGALLSGKIEVGTGTTRNGARSSRAISLQSFLLGVILIALYLAGGAVVALIPALRDPLIGLLAHASLGILPVVIMLLCLNAVAEELFFRGGLYAAAGGQHAVLLTAFVYALSMVPTGIPMLVAGSAILGAVLGLQRRVTGGVLGPIITHLTWLAGMLLLMPATLNLWG
jgi:membrane protease YdiL (CAAX protease family)